MKKLLTLLSAVILCALLAGCEESQTKSKTSPTPKITLVDWGRIGRPGSYAGSDYVVFRVEKTGREYFLVPREGCICELNQEPLRLEAK